MQEFEKHSTEEVCNMIFKVVKGWWWFIIGKVRSCSKRSVGSVYVTGFIFAHLPNFMGKKQERD
jgi:hypothetical protein